LSTVPRIGRLVLLDPIGFPNPYHPPGNARDERVRVPVRVSPAITYRATAGLWVLSAAVVLALVIVRWPFPFTLAEVVLWLGCAWLAGHAAGRLSREFWRLRCLFLAESVARWRARAMAAEQRLAQYEVGR
jgi:hypothetical protein